MQDIYRRIQKEYDDNRSAALREVERKKKEVYEKEPKILEIDDKINHINNNLIQLRNDSITTSVKNEKFYITRKNFISYNDTVILFNPNMLDPVFKTIDK